MPLEQPLSPSMALRHGPPAWAPGKAPHTQFLGTVPLCGSTAQHLGIAPLYRPHSDPPPLSPEQCPARWVLLLPLSLAPSWVGMQPSGPGKEHQS